MHWSRRVAKHRKDNRNSDFKLFIPARCLSSAEKKDLEKITIFIDKHRILSVEFYGEKLKGVWMIEKKNSNWHVKRIQAAPEVKAE